MLRKVFSTLNCYNFQLMSLLLCYFLILQFGILLGSALSCVFFLPTGFHLFSVRENIWLPRDAADSGVVRAVLLRRGSAMAAPPAQLWARISSSVLTFCQVIATADALNMNCVPVTVLSALPASVSGTFPAASWRCTIFGKVQRGGIFSPISMTFINSRTSNIDNKCTNYI